MSMKLPKTSTNRIIKISTNRIIFLGHKHRSLSGFGVVTVLTISVENENLSAKSAVDRHKHLAVCWMLDVRKRLVHSTKPFFFRQKHWKEIYWNFIPIALTIKKNLHSYYDNHSSSIKPANIVPYESRMDKTPKTTGDCEEKYSNVCIDRLHFDYRNMPSSDTIKYSSLRLIRKRLA